MNMFKRLGNKIFPMILVSGIVLAIAWDLASSVNVTVQEGTFKKESDFPKTNYSRTDVAVVPSDYESLTSPTAVTNPNLTDQQVEDMVRKAIELQGGLQGIVKPGDWVLIKPNIVNNGVASGSGEVTDTRVIKAVIKIVHEFTGGSVKISVAEGSPRTTKTELPYAGGSSPQWKKLWDTAGYPELVSDPELAGIPFDTLNLNGTPPGNPWQDLESMDVPGGGVAAPQKGKYWLHKAIRQANVYIDCPVLKIHDTGITNALKNQIGLAACTKYGFNKMAGVPQLGYAVKLRHEKLWPCDWQDEEIVDLSALAHIDLSVVDAILTLEKQKSLLKDKSGNIINQVRFNTIIAGKDPVAVDVVGAKLIGINPDDVDHVCLASKIGLGTNDPQKIRVVGRSVDVLKKRLRKLTTKTRLIFGRGNRTWLMSSAFSVSGVSDPINHEFISGEAGLEPRSGQSGWSEPIYFFDDRLDLGSYFSGANDVVSYAFTYFYAPKKQQAELWIGSDESLIVYLNHKPVYTFSGTRTYGDVQLLSERPVITIEAGENTLMVKSLQRSGYYDFALNICEVETDLELIGNRVDGLKFHTEPAQVDGVPSEPNSAVPSRIVLAPNYPNPFNAETNIRFDLPKTQRVSLAITSLTGRPIRLLTDKTYSAGSHRVRWDGLDDRGYAMPTGVYLYTLRTGNGTVSRKLSMIK